ncbi:MAG: glycosyltransferase family 2 protein, partial [Candidatus Parvarchaeum sp.]
MKISVIIATRNRADALETISLPSLLKQDFKDFEVIIWDASDDDKSKNVVEKFIQSYPDMIIRYFKAPRAGLASQRNDAVKMAKGDIIFFIDDDSKVSKDGLTAIYEAFQCNKDIIGVTLPFSSEQHLI